MFFNNQILDFIISISVQICIYLAELKIKNFIIFKFYDECLSSVLIVRINDNFVSYKINTNK